jgi:acetyl esterase
LLPPVSIGLAACDVLHDEGAALAARIARAGGRVTRRTYPGMIHGFVSLPHVAPTATAALADLARDVRRSMTGDAP